MPPRLDHPLLAHALVLVGIGLMPGLVEDCAIKVDHASLLSDPRHLHEQAAQGIPFAAVEFMGVAKVWLLVARQIPEDSAFIYSPVNTAVRDEVQAVDIELSQSDRM